MIPGHFEYLFLLLLYLLVIFTLLKEPVTRLLKKASFWLSCIVFCAIWATLEMYALQHHWWIFSPEKICGVFIATVPIEEYIVFVLIHLSTAATWSTLKELYDVA